MCGVDLMDKGVLNVEILVVMKVEKFELLC